MMRQIPVFVAICGVATGVFAITAPGCDTVTSTTTPEAADMTATCSAFTPVPECMPAELPVKPLGGSRQMVISSLVIARAEDGFDLNCDGKPDNLLAPLAGLVDGPIADSFQTRHDLIIPIELFGYTGSDSACTKFAFYLGRVNEDRDGDGATTSWAPGASDCNDTDPAVHPGATEIVGNLMDDDCDGLADNPMPNVPSTDTTDHDGDGQSMADGDCDDRNDTPAHLALAKTRYKGTINGVAAKDICGNGIDEDCDGIADNNPSCDPFADNVAPMHVQALSFDNAMTTGLDGGVLSADGLKPYIVFPDGHVTSDVLLAGPDLFELDLDLTSTFNLKLTLSGARVNFKLADKPNGTYLVVGTLGGVLEAVSLAQIHLDAGSSLSKEQSLLDAIFAGGLGGLFALPYDKDHLHNTPDIDVDGDGLEAFWEEGTHTTGDAGVTIDIVDTCRDGDGTIVHNGDDGVAYCPLAKDAKGNYRFVDGLSAALKFTAVPAKLIDVVVK